MYQPEVIKDYVKFREEHRTPTMTKDPGSADGRGTPPRAEGLEARSKAADEHSRVLCRCGRALYSGLGRRATMSDLGDLTHWPCPSLSSQVS